MDESLFKKTMRTMAIMVGACVTFVGALTLIVLFIVGRAVSPAQIQGVTVDTAPPPATAPASKPDVPSASPGAAPATTPRRFGMTKSPT
jgi:hypothetical protein